MSKKTIIIAIAMIAILLLGASYFFFMNKPADPQTAGLTKVENYNYVEAGEITCQSLIAECGYCVGEVINKECYVDKSKLTPAQLQQMGF